MLWIFGSININYYYSTKIAALHNEHVVHQCFDAPIRMECRTGSMVHVVGAYHRQTWHCPGEFHSFACHQRALWKPVCVGQEACEFMAPRVRLSDECGFSNDFLVTFQCVPGSGGFLISCFVF